MGIHTWRRLSRAPSLIAFKRLTLLGEESKRLADGDLARAIVEGALPKAGIIEVVFVVLTLCERAIDDFVGVISRAAIRGRAVWDVILRGVAATTGALPLMS